MGKSIKLSGLEIAILKDLMEYRDDIAEEVKKAANDVSNYAVQELKEKSPKKTGEYSFGWTRKQSKNTESAFGVVVYNKDKPWLTHLLENGHAKVNGGFVPGIQHIKPVEEKAIKSFEEKVEEIIKNGT